MGLSTIMVFVIPQTGGMVAYLMLYGCAEIFTIIPDSKAGRVRMQYELMNQDLRSILTILLVWCFVTCTEYDPSWIR
ncbi:hypothetical protein BKA67DRAFT_588653 [Truncatella angustata]|uniref:Uncharacterized protein n=1 Tax=Truncatella angustata TaxID=152316 RepID=A0A9P8RHX5_9PEZI|nr:uncharacterized protein BKA67DRAFT_588653 [Truncatella angustata]KAH6640093.1 hypothetical protein BKA67DRAFT_588653 [Truncatella angustata]